MRFKSYLFSPILFIFLAISCSKPTCTNNTKYKIGERLGGGKIGYILKSGDNGYDPCVTHGLIVSDTVTGEGQKVYPWGIDTQYIGGTSSAIGSGAANTNLILSKCTKLGIAAQYCANFESNGYNDWYLPSIDELKMIWVNKDSIGGFVTRSMYWSSSESDLTNAWYMFTSPTGQNKNNAGYVRPVRSF